MRQLKTARMRHGCPEQLDRPKTNPAAAMDRQTSGFVENQQIIVSINQAEASGLSEGEMLSLPASRSWASTRRPASSVGVRPSMSGR